MNKRQKKKIQWWYDNKNRRYVPASYKQIKMLKAAFKHFVKMWNKEYSEGRIKNE